jgi:hypothetical protein
MPNVVVELPSSVESGRSQPPYFHTLPLGLVPEGTGAEDSELREIS